MSHCILPLSFTYIHPPVSPSHSLCLPSVIRQTDLLAQQHVRPPLYLTPLTNRLPTSESSLWPCHSLARLIGFHLSLQRKGSDYKQINRVGLHGGWPALAARIPCDRRGDWECVKVVGFENREFQGQVVYCGGAARMMEVAAGMMWLVCFFFFSLEFAWNSRLSSTHFKYGTWMAPILKMQCTGESYFTSEQTEKWQTVRLVQ